MATNGDNYSFNNVEIRTEISWMCYNMYLDKYDRMRVLDFAQKEINERLKNNPECFSCRDLMWSVLRKVHFADEHSYFEIGLLVQELLSVFGFQHLRKAEELKVAFTNILDQFILVDDVYWFSVRICREQYFFEPAHEQQNHDLPPGFQHFQAADSDDAFAPHQVPHQPEHHQADAFGMADGGAATTVPATEPEQVVDATASPAEAQPAEFCKVDECADLGEEAASEHGLSDAEPDEKSVWDDLGHFAHRSVGVQCDAEPTLEFTACLKMVWTSIKQFFRKAFAKLMARKSNAEELFRSSRVSL